MDTSFKYDFQTAPKSDINDLILLITAWQIKGTVMQNEKALINDRLRVSKVF